MLVVFILALAIGEGMPNPFTQPLAIRIGFIALALIVVGILVGWRWEFAGGVVSLAGWCLFFTSVIEPKHLNSFLLLLALPGILYLLSALLRCLDKRQTS
jgi:hypothetical protein